MTTRRDFLKTTAGAGMGAAMGAVPASAFRSPPALHLGAVTPTAVASGNGLEAVRTALEMIHAGEDTMDAVVAGVLHRFLLRGGMGAAAAVIDDLGTVVHRPVHAI